MSLLGVVGEEFVRELVLLVGHESLVSAKKSSTSSKGIYILDSPLLVQSQFAPSSKTTFLLIKSC